MASIQYKEGYPEYRQFTLRSGVSNREKLSRALDRMGGILENELTPRQREYVELYYYSGLSMPEIAALSKTSVPTVSRTLARARSRLSRVLRYALR